MQGGGRDQGLNSGASLPGSENLGVFPPPKQKGFPGISESCYCDIDRCGPSPRGRRGTGLWGQDGKCFQDAEPSGPRGRGSGREGTAARAQSSSLPHCLTGYRKECPVTCGICGQTNYEVGCSPREDREPAPESFGYNKHPPFME